MNTRAFSAVIPFLVLACCSPASDTLSLAGKWRFQLDRQDAGIHARWFEQRLPDRVRLPGALAAQGIGDDISVDTKWTGGIVDRSWFTAPEYAKYRVPGQVKVPFWLQPEKYYVGPAWYQREVEIPRDWQGKQLLLTLERPHWETRVWVDGQLIATNNALATPHEYALGPLPPGRHTLTIRVDNRLGVDVGHDSHSVTDHTQGNWNGIAGRLELRARSRLWIAGQRIIAKNDGTVRFELTLGSDQFDPVAGEVLVTIRDRQSGQPAGSGGTVFQIPRGLQPDPTHLGGREFPAEIVLKLNQAPKLWSEFSPALYTAEVRLRTGDQVCDRAETVFGFREISTQGTQFVLNGQKLFFRGTLECAIFPKTGHPPTDVDSWKKVLTAAKAHGLNMLRFHSWCPPEAAFVAADELGVYFHVECSSWANSSTSLGDGKPVDRWIYAEADRILKYYGHHPSFVLMLYGNEPGGPKHVAFLKQWVEHYKARDPRRLYSSGAGWPQIPENQFHVVPDPRIQAWGGGLKSRINARPPETMTDYRAYIRARQVPVISHEIGQWCVYPRFAEIKKYTGYLKPRNFEIFRETLRTHHLEDLEKDFLLASGRLQTLCYKEDIESALRTPGMGGFQLLDLHDFPGQGTALVGVLDPFWESKGYVTPQEYSRFCNATVPLARLPKRVFTTEESFEAEVEVAHFGPTPLSNAASGWRLVSERGVTVREGRFSPRTIPVDNAIGLDRVRLPLKDVAAPARYKLVVEIKGQSPHDPTSATRPRPVSVENDWDVWVYPSALATAPPAGVSVTETLDDAALGSLNNGGKVLLLIPPARVAPDKKLGKVALGFSSIFWNTAWTRRQPPHTLGILCDPKHPLFAEFPTEYHSNWQWWYLISRAGPMILDDLPAQLRPTVQVIDDWFTARRLGLVFEAKIGQGQLLVCSIDLTRDLDSNPVARQFRHSLLQYMGSKRFNPHTTVTPESIRALYAEPSAMARLGARVLRASSHEAGYESDRAIDEDPGTLWHTQWTGGGVREFPHEIQLQFEQDATLRGLTVLPRQDNNRNGWIKDYAVYVSEDGRQWGQPITQGRFAPDMLAKSIPFKAPVKTRFLRLIAVSGYAREPHTSIAELTVWE